MGPKKAKCSCKSSPSTVSPWGIDIFIPRFWSLDWQRDLNWRAILELLRCWEIERQGEKRHLSQTEAKARNKRMYQLSEELRAAGYVGDELQAEVERLMGLHPMDGGTFRRCVRAGKALAEGEKAA